MKSYRSQGTTELAFDDCSHVTTESSRRYIEVRGLPLVELLPLALREGNSKKSVYQMHKWWARRLSSVFRAILLASVLDEHTDVNKFMSLLKSSPNIGSNLKVFDPFVGGGTTLVEAQELGFDVAGFEIDPVAWYITRQELTYVDPDILESVFRKVAESVRYEISSLYKTTTPDGREAEVVYAFWVSTVRCPGCNFNIELHPHYQLHRNRKLNEQVVFCSDCHSVQTVAASSNHIICNSAECSTETLIGLGTISAREIRCPNCQRRWKRDLLRGEHPADRHLFAIEFLDIDPQGRATTSFKAASSQDKSKFSVAEQLWLERMDKVSWMRPFLTAMIPTSGRQDLRPINYGFRYYHQLFNARQLLALSYIGEAVASLEDSPVKELLLLALSDSLSSNNMLCSYAFDYKKLTPLFGLHGYQIVTRPVENNVWGTSRGRGSYTNCVRKIKRAMQGKRERTLSLDTISPQSGPKCPDEDSPGLLIRGDARSVSIADDSIDLVVTDPPYFDNLQYGELSDLFFAWLRPLLIKTFPQEMTPTTCLDLPGGLAQRRNGQSPEADFQRGLGEIFGQCRRILKANGLLVFTFHHRNHVAWNAVSDALAECKFYVVNVCPVRSEGRSGFHSSPGNLRWDAVFVCRKSETLQDGERLKDFPVDMLVSDWERRLDGVDGAPTFEDWGNLRRALDACNSANRRIRGAIDD